MTIISEPYVPSCPPARVEISCAPMDILPPPPRKVQLLPILVYTFHPIVIAAGFVPVVLVGWLGFIFMKLPNSFGNFLFAVYLVLPVVGQLGVVILRAKSFYWFFKYGAHGLAKFKPDIAGIEVVDAATYNKIIDIGVEPHLIPEEAEEPIVLYDRNQPTRYLSLLPYKNTFTVRFDRVQVHPSYKSVLSIITFLFIISELVVIMSVSSWSNIQRINL